MVARGSSLRKSWNAEVEKQKRLYSLLLDENALVPIHRRSLSFGRSFIINLIRQRRLEILGSLFITQAFEKLFILAASSQILIIGSVGVVGCAFRTLP